MELLTWSETQRRTPSHCTQYFALLDSNIDDVSFGRKENGVAAVALYCRVLSIERHRSDRQMLPLETPRLCPL